MIWRCQRDTTYRVRALSEESPAEAPQRGGGGARVQADLLAEWSRVDEEAGK